MIIAPLPGLGQKVGEYPHLTIKPVRENMMPGSVKEMLAAANSAVPTISPQDAKALIERGQALVVDVRDGLEIQSSGKVQGAKHVARGMLEFRADPESAYYDNAFDREKTVIVYCASGGRSALAGKTLQDLGYKDVRNLGGFKGWADSGGAVEKV
jgi:rhodanese-related sulfurtransferase